MCFSSYDIGDYYDEMIEAPEKFRPGAILLADKIKTLPKGEIQNRQAVAEKALFDMGITFSVYGHQDGAEKIWPLDIIPRIVEAREWNIVEKGLIQRITALNLFIHDVYNERRIIRDKIIPEDLIESAEGFLKPCIGLKPPKNIWCHITGTDLVRDKNGQFLVLEDNLRCPSGVSYVLANRRLMRRTFPEVFTASKVKPVEEYPAKLLDMLLSIAPENVIEPVVGLLTPGIYNSAYFEHSFLAHEMGIELVEGRDLVVSDGFVCMKTTKGLKRVDVIYRRINDNFIDPETFMPESLLGVPGIMEVYRQGRISLANAPGTGVADDKVIYAFVPQMIKYYLDQDPIIENVPTYLCWKEKDRKFVLDNLEKLVVKSANESGGYGMLIGPASSKAEQETFAAKINAMPRNFIAQPTISLSRVPVVVGDSFEGRHVDLRPYIVYGEDIYVLPGGLTRVALRKGSLVVNSSQGGGSKDTWVVDESLQDIQNQAQT